MTFPKSRAENLTRESMRAAGVLLTLSALFAVLSVPTRADHPTRYVETKSPGGIVYHHRFDPLTPYASLSFGWAVPEDRKTSEGLRTMLGSLMTNGVFPAQPTEFYEQLADLHATASLGLGEDRFVGEAKAPAKQLGEAMDLVMRALKTGTPNVKTFRRTRTSLINGEKQGEKNPQLQVSRTASMYLLGDHPITRRFDPKRFDNIKIADLAAWRQTAFNDGPLHIVVSGRIAAGDAGRVVDKAFASWPTTLAKQRVKPALVKPKPGSVAVETSAKQTTVQLMGPTALIEGREGPLAGLVQSVLGAGPSSRLFNAVRGALGSTYGASASFWTLAQDQRAIVLSGSVDPGQVDASIAAMRKAYAEWYDTGITEAELKTQRERMIAGFASSFRDPATANRSLMSLLIVGRPPSELETYEQRLMTLTPADANTFIKSRFPKPDDLTLIIGKAEGGTFAAGCAVATWKDVAKACTASR